MSGILITIFADAPVGDAFIQNCPLFALGRRVEGDEPG